MKGMRVLPASAGRRVGAIVAMLAGLLAVATPAVAAPECDVPAYLLTTDSQLDKVAAAIDQGQRLDILVIGTASSSLPGAGEAERAYPARFEAALRGRLPGVAVQVAVEVLPKTAAEAMVPRLSALMAAHKPVLAIWQTGTTDAIRAIDPDDFRDAVDEGVAALREAGADVLLVNPQYSPRLETMISLTPYLDRMRLVAQQYGVPLFDRFAIMRHWNESGTFDLFGPVKGLDMARAVHDCLGRALASFVLDAARIDAAGFRARQ
jgi:hypothetical protein